MPPESVVRCNAALQYLKILPMLKHFVQILSRTLKLNKSLKNLNSSVCFVVRHFPVAVICLSLVPSLGICVHSSTASLMGGQSMPVSCRR